MRFLLAVIFTATLFTSLLALLGAVEARNEGPVYQTTRKLEQSTKTGWPTPVIPEPTDRYRAYRFVEKDFQNLIHGPGIYDQIIKEIRRRQDRPDRQFVASTTRVTYVALNDQRYILFNYPEEKRRRGTMQQKFWLKDPTGKRQPELQLTSTQFDALEQVLIRRGNTVD